MIFITQCDSPALWQIYLSDPASITMEGILIFNKHLLFLLTVIVLFVGWLLSYTIDHFIEYNNKFSSKLVHSKELETIWTSIPALVTIFKRGKKKPSKKKNKQMPAGVFVAEYRYPAQTDRQNNPRIDLLIDFEYYKNSSDPSCETLLAPIFDPNVVRASLMAPNLSASRITLAVPYPEKIGMSDTDIHAWVYRHSRVHHGNGVTSHFDGSGFDVFIKNTRFLETAYIPTELLVNCLKKL